MMMRFLIQAWLVRLGSFGLAIALLLGAMGVKRSSVAQAVPVAQTQRTGRQAEGDRLLQQGLQQNQTSQYQEALRSFEQALQIYREIGDRNREAVALNNLGAAYSSLSRYEEAINYHKQALSIYRALGDRNREAAALSLLGITHDSLSRYEEAINYHKQALSIYQEVRNRNGEALTLNSLGLAYDFLLRYEKAINYYKQALSIFQEIRNRNGEASALNNLGSAYGSLSRYEEAINYYKQALSISQAVKDRNGEAWALKYLGSAYESLSRYEEAISYYKQALPIFQEIRNRNGEASALNNLGNAYDSLSRYEEAISYYKQALSISQAVKNRDGEASALGSLGNAYDSLSRYEEAISYHKQALPIFQEIRNRNGEAGVLHNLGVIQFKTRQFPQAEQSLRQAIQVYETIRSENLSDENKISLFEEQAKSYRKLQEVLIALKQPDAALEVAERGRSRALVELLAKRLSPTVPASTSILAPTLQQIQQIARTQNATLVQYSIIYKHGDSIPGKAQYFKESQLYIWVISPQGKVTFRSVDLNQIQNLSLSDLVQTSREALGARSREIISLTPKGRPTQSTQNLQALHKLLIAPIADLLPTNPNDRVVFIPQAELFLVPFAALQDAKGKYLIEQHTILTAPSIQVLDLTHQQRKEAGIGKALVVGNPTMPSVSWQPGEKSQPLPALPGAEKEATAIAALLRTQAIIGNQATEAAIVQQMQQADIIHLATHASFDNQRGLNSSIALAPNPNQPAKDQFGRENGLLTAEEILDLKLKANLVVLSACDTGRGKITGDGVIGLSRSLITSGVPSVIASLWSVPDAPTAELMTRFYRNWQERRLDKAQALRQAMLDTMKTHPNPIDWAAFTLIGEAQ